MSKCFGPTERQVQSLFWECRQKSYNLIVPNFTPLNWHECDLWCLTKSGYVHEFEIKRSVVDFKNDFKKRDGCRRKRHNASGRLKHDRLKERDASCPSTFSYIVPTDLIKQEDVPDYAGLIYISETQDFNIIKKPVRLHNNKPLGRIINTAKTAFYYRYWVERTKRMELKEELDVLIECNKTLSKK